MKELTEENALYRLAAYCSKAERCEFDLQKKMTQWYLSENVQQKILKRLKDENFYDHYRYCRSFVRDKFKYNKWGENKIIFELKKRRIAEKYYQEALDEITKEDVNEQLLKILQVRNRTIKAKDNYDRRNKLIRFALSKGYAMDSSIKMVETFLKTDED